MKPAAARGGQPPASAPFWRRKRLESLSRAEWESLCDGCAKCCLHKVEYVDTGEVRFSDIACRLLDLKTCRCRDYPGRTEAGTECVALDAVTVRYIPWLPSTCAYRLVRDGKDLPAWHPLITGDPESVHRSGNSVRGRAIAEDPAIDPEDRLVRWAE